MTKQLTWSSIIWPEPLTVAAASYLLRHRAADPTARRVILEVRGESGRVRYRLGVEQEALPRVARDLLPARLREDERSSLPLTLAGQVTMPGGHRAALATEQTEAAVKAMLADLAATRRDELLVLQLVLGRPRRPLRPGANAARPLLRWPWQPSAAPATELRRAARDKFSEHGIECVLRLGATAGTRPRARGLLVQLFGALRTLESPDVRLHLRPVRPSAVTSARSPWRWPLRLNASELAAVTAWPIGEPPFPGLPSFHPRRLPAEASIAARGRIVAEGEDADGRGRPLALTPAASLQHLHLLGPTGTGKSTLLLRLALQDMADGRAVVVIDPKGDLVADLLARVPEHRQRDVVVLDPTDPAPVGLNPLLAGSRSSEARADGVLAVFKDLYAASWGPRTNDILHACLLSLSHRDDASLVMVPLLLANPGFRRSVVGKAVRDDPLGLGSFWAWYEATSEAERAAAVAPLMNKLRSVLLRPGIRAVLGQTKPRFAISEVFTQRRILLVGLAKGTLGPEAAALLGSLVVAQLWQTALGRSALPPERRHPVMVYVDEVQDYLHLPTDLGDALAQARGLGVGFTLAHQFLAQLPRAMHAAVLTNARSRVCFQLPHEDAVVMARGHRELVAEDFMALDAYEVYASLLSEGRSTPYAFGRTRPMPQPSADPDSIRALSRSRFGRPLSEVEAGWLALNEVGEGDERLGRRPRRAS